MAGLFGFIATFLGASLFFIAEGVPFTPLQTLWVNFTVHVFLAVGLGYGKPREGLMAERPRPPENPILPSYLFTYLVVIGIVMATSTLAVIWWASGAHGDSVARTMGLTVFSLANVWFALETVDPTRSVFSGGVFDNATLLKGAGLALLATIAATELGVLNRLLGTEDLDADQWVISIVASLAVLAVAEGAKALKVRTEEAHQAATPVATA